MEVATYLGHITISLVNVFSTASQKEVKLDKPAIILIYFNVIKTYRAKDTETLENFV